jgi:23S rRNA (guanosine2251-2'-O)-methyltransferase
VTRASAGASELLPTAVCDTTLEAADFFRGHGLTIACTARKSAVSLYECDLTQPLFLLIGGEKRGITRSFLEQADLLLRIPYGRSFPYSLGAAASTAVVAFEVLRQRSAGGSGSPDAAEETL